MIDYNKVILVGRLTADPQMSHLPSQTPVTEFGLAVNQRWKGQDGKRRTETCVVDCRCYGQQANTLHEYIKEGRTVLVEGRLQPSWEDKTGQKRSKLRVVVERFQLFGRRLPGTGTAIEDAQPLPIAPCVPPAPEPRPADRADSEDTRHQQERETQNA